MEKMNIDIENLKISQLGYVYKDVEAQAKIMEAQFGMGKFAILEEDDLNEYNYRGKDSKFATKIAFSRFLNVQIELIQWVEGECLFKEFIEEGKEGLHHLGVYVNDIEAHVEEFKKMGLEVIFSGHRGKQHVAYLDSLDKFGIYIELQETKRRRNKK